MTQEVLPAVATGGNQFRASVKQGSLIGGNDAELLCQAQLARLGLAGVSRGFSADRPSNLKVGSRSLQGPDVLREFSSVGVPLVPEASQVVVESLFERAFGQTNILFPNRVASSMDSGLIHDR